MFKSKTNKRGVALFVVLAVILVVVVLASVVLKITLNQSRLGLHRVSRIQAYYANQAGINYALEKLRLGNDPNWPVPIGTFYQRTLCRGGAGCSNPGDIVEPDLPLSIQNVVIKVSAPSATCTPPTGSSVCISATANYTYIP